MVEKQNINEFNVNANQEIIRHVCGLLHHDRRVLHHHGHAEWYKNKA